MGTCGEGGEKTTSDVSSCLPARLKQCLLFFIAVYSGLAGPLPSRGSPVCTSQLPVGALGLQMHDPQDSGHLNSEPHTGVANTSPQLSPQPLVFIFIFNLGTGSH